MNSYKYVNLFSEFVKDVAQRLKITYEKALKKIETNKALQKEWREMKSQRKELFVPIRTVGRASAQSVAMAEQPPAQGYIDPQIENEAQNQARRPLILQEIAAAEFDRYRQNVRQQRANDRVALREALVLNPREAREATALENDGGFWGNLFGAEEEAGVPVAPQYVNAQPREALPQALQDQRRHLLDLIEQEVALQDPADQDARREQIIEHMLSIQERAILGLPPTALQIQLEEARRADELRVIQARVAGRKVSSLGKKGLENIRARKQAEAKAIEDKRVEDERLALLAAAVPAVATPKKEAEPKKERKSSGKKGATLKLPFQVSIPNSPWVEIHSKDGTVDYFNTDTKLRQRDAPPELNQKASKDTPPSASTTGVGLTRNMGKVLKHLTSHIADPKEPVDPRDYAQASMIMKDIKHLKLKGGGIAYF